MYVSGAVGVHRVIVGVSLSHWRIQTPSWGASPLLTSPPVPFPYIPFAFRSPFHSFAPSRSVPLEVGPLKYSYGVWGAL